MVIPGIRARAWLELAVILFQVFGVASLCINRLAPATRWSEWGRIGFVTAMIGLGIAGALRGGQDSEFSLFAGGTMTILLIGMTIGSGYAHTIDTTHLRARSEPNS